MNEHTQPRCKKINDQRSENQENLLVTSIHCYSRWMYSMFLKILNDFIFWSSFQFIWYIFLFYPRCFLRLLAHTACEMTDEWLVYDYHREKNCNWPKLSDALKHNSSKNFFDLNLNWNVSRTTDTDLLVLKHTKDIKKISFFGSDF